MRSERGARAGAASLLGSVLLAATVAAATEPTTPVPGAPDAVRATPARGAAVATPASRDTGVPGLGDLGLGGKEPIEIRARELDLQYEQRRVVYRGAVDARQGDLHLICDELTIIYQGDAGGAATTLDEVRAHGHVRVEQGGRRASGDVALFDQIERKIRLMGNAEVHDGPNVVRGDQITVFLDEGRTLVEAGRDRRVSAVLHPESASGKAATPEARR